MTRIVSIAAVLVLVTASSARPEPGWTETFDRFEEYPYGEWPGDGSKDLPEPWQECKGFGAHEGLGIQGSAGVQRPWDDWNWGHAFRRTAATPRVGDAAVAKIMLPSGIPYQAVMLAFTTDTTAGERGQFAGGPRAFLHVGGSPQTGFARVEFRVQDAAGRDCDRVAAAPHPFLPADTWYDVRLVLGPERTVTAAYKHVDMTDWIPVGTLTVPPDFQPSQVAIAASRRGSLDDVAYVAAAAANPPFAASDPQ